MQWKMIEVIAPRGHADTLLAVAEQHRAIDCQLYNLEDEDLVAVRILAAPAQRQAIVDGVQLALHAAEDRWRVTIQPVDGTLPALGKDDERTKAERVRSLAATREELYEAVAGGATLSSTYMLLVGLSTLVAGIGLISDNVAIVVGAMVIAPLLGPNLALALAAALGDKVLLGQALATNAAGIALAVVLAAMFSYFVPVDLDSRELVLRTSVGYDGIALALASGAAAALSLVSGLSTTLVGVMVAAALMPPAATAGLMLGAGRLDMAQGALMLLGVNIASILLMAEGVFFLKGIQPHRWYERKGAHQSLGLNVLISAILLALAAVIIARSKG